MIILAGPDKKELRKEAYTAFAASGLPVKTEFIHSRDAVSSHRSPESLLVVDVALYESDQQAAEALAALAPMQVVVILPAGWNAEPFKRLPNLLTGSNRPITWSELANSIRGRLNISPRSNGTETSPASAKPHPSRSRSSRGRSRRRRPTVRLGFYGTRGGAGVSTAALVAAQALAEAGQTVGLFDATRRGDLHLMVGKSPTDRVQHGKITLFLSAPDEERARQFDAVIVDGGRRRGDFNAEWVEVDNPLSESRVRDLAGLAPVDDDSQSSGGRSSRRPRRRKRGFNLGSLISFELTD